MPTLLTLRLLKCGFWGIFAALCALWIYVASAIVFLVCSQFARLCAPELLITKETLPRAALLLCFAWGTPIGIYVAVRSMNAFSGMFGGEKFPKYLLQPIVLGDDGGACDSRPQ